MKRALRIKFGAALVVAAWVYLFTGTPRWGANLNLKDAPVTSIDLSWFGRDRTTAESNQCARVVEVLRKGRESRAPMSPGWATITLHHADGTTNRFILQPSERAGCLAITGQAGQFAISKGELLDILEKAGLMGRDQR